MNNYPIATILGGGGFIGRYLVRNLTRKNFRCIIPTRNPFTKTYLKTQAPPGAIEIIKFGQNNFDDILQQQRIYQVFLLLLQFYFQMMKKLKKR